MKKKIKKIFFEKYTVMYTSYTLDSISKVCQDYHSRIARLEEEKYDLEYIVKGKDFQVHIDIHTHKTITIILPKKNTFNLRKK